MIALALLLALVQQPSPRPAPPPGTGEQAGTAVGAGTAQSPGQVRPARVITGTLAWEVPLPSPLAGPPRVLSVPGAETLVLVPLERSVEARRPADGTVEWSLEGLQGDGLMHDAPVKAGEQPVLGCASVRPDGTFALVVFAAADGRVVFETPLPGQPAGPPTPLIPAGGGEPLWFVPLVPDRVATFNADGTPGPVWPAGANIEPPLATIAGRVLATVGDDRRLVTLGPAPRRTGAKDALLGAEARSRRGFFAAGQRSFASWNCRPRSGAGLSCHVSWRQLVGGSITVPPLTTATSVIAASWDTHLYAFKPRSGHLLWRAKAGLRLTTPPIFWDAETIAVLPESASSVLFFRADTGAAAGQVSAGKSDVLVAGVIRAGDALVVPALAYPTFSPVLRAYAITLAAPPPPKKPTETAPAPETAPATPPEAVPAKPEPPAESALTPRG